MEFPFDINNLFPERISFLDQALVSGHKSVGRPDQQSKIASVIDELGKASSMAQQLPAPITSALKLRSNPHWLYLIKEEKSNGGHGAGVGFLKVGYKKLFLLDQQGAHVEAEPLCVLDFYIAESLQRHGYGLELFDFMLQHKQVEPSLMAYDRPSAKFLSFLAKHYCLNQSVLQVNNFVVFDGFFRNKSVGQSRKALPKKPDGEIKPYSLMAREVCEERKAMPWPFPPPVSGFSPYSRSHSVGSSPSRTPPTPAKPQGPAHGPGGHRGPQTAHSVVSDSCKARRTRLSPPSLPPLRMPMENQLPSLRLPPVTGSSKRSDRISWDRDAKTELLPVCQGSPLAPGGGVLHTAQWVRHNQELRSTRPW